MATHTERFEMRLDQGLLDRVDDWSSNQPDAPSRAEAIRRLIEISLGGMAEMRASESLIISLLCELHKGMKVKGELDPEFIQSALVGGHYWSLDWAYPGLLHRYRDDKKTVDEVINILDMWSFIEEACDEIAEAEKKLTKKSVPLIRFPGFDGNNESSHLGIARFLIEKMDRFTKFKDRDLNSHSQSIAGYQKMLNVFEPIRKKLIGRKLTVDEILEVLNARRA